MIRFTVKILTAVRGRFRLNVAWLWLLLPVIGSAAQLHGLVLNQAQSDIAGRIESELSRLMYLGDRRINGNISITEQRPVLGVIEVQVSYQGVVLKKIIQRRRTLPRASVDQVVREIYQTVLELDRRKRREVIRRLREASRAGK